MILASLSGPTFLLYRDNTAILEETLAKVQVWRKKQACPARARALLDLSSNVLRLGEIVYLPCMLFGFLLIPASCVIVGFGLILFTLSVFTWLYSKFKGLEVIDFWLYKYSRHPQYLGFLVWSYGLMLLNSYVGASRGGYIPPPSFPWLISALTIVGTALHEEQTMIKKHGEKYKKYMEKTPFMLPLPKKLSTIITAPAKISHQ